MKKIFRTINPLVYYSVVYLTLSLALIQCRSEQGDVVIQSQEKSSFKLDLKSAKQYITAKGTDYRLTELENINFETFSQPDEFYPTLMLDPGKTFQTIEGFGGAITDAAAETFYKLPEAKQKEILTAYFDQDEGIAYNLFRTHINSCDFSSESYAYSEVDGDTGLEHFTIEHDLKHRIPLIKRAQSLVGKEFRLLASPWSPPAWMKTNNNMLQGGQLKKEFYQTWADYYVRFVEEYSKEDIPIWGLTVQNEPMAVQTWESCVYSAEEERDFVKNYLGPTLKNAGLHDVKLIIWDHNRGIMYQRAAMVYNDPEASKYVWGTGFHWYTGDHFENVRMVHEAFPDKKSLFTEGCVYPFDYSTLLEWHWGERYGESIIHDLNNGASGWIDWNILLDETGGPNHVGNYCLAPVIGNTKTGEVVYMNSFYYLGHFSKFIHPGAHRITCSSNDDYLLAIAMLNPDGTVVVVAMNATEKEKKYKIWVEGKGINSTIPAHAMVTVVFK